MRMAADQRKKRLNPSSVVGRSSREQCKVKKKKLDLPRYDLKMKSNISLEWDDKKKTVVSKREQIGISRRDLIPYVDPVAHHHNILADVLAVPQEIFDTSILKEVVSSEVWQTCLSEKERKLLAQFLPKGGDAYEVVQDLLSGVNFHFGNPFLKWGETLCSGNFHPDVVLQRELSFKANKRTYYSELQKYHNDMIGNLNMWKERWVLCKDPEKEIIQKMWRSRKAADRSMLIAANESRPHDTNDQHVATSDSCSWVADEKACGSDNLAVMTGESKRRNDLAEGKYDNSSDGLNVIARPREGEKLCKRNIQRGDGTRYMSYIKVSKEQHQRVISSMKSSGNSIQSRSLNHVLGNLDKFHVQPYEAFEEEVRMKLHEHWLQLANKHLPAGLANWRRRQLEKQQLMKSLGQEVQEKVASMKEDEEEDNLLSEITEQANIGKSDSEPTSATTEFPISCQEKVEEKSNDLLQEQVDNSKANEEIESEDEDDDEDEDEDEENPDHRVFEDGRTNVTRNYGPSMEDGNASVSVSPQNEQQHLQPITFTPEFQPLVLDSNDNVIIAKTDNFTSSEPDYSSNMNHMDVTVHQRDHRHHLSSASNVWPSVTMPFYHSTCVSNEYAPVPSELSLGNSSVVAHQPIPLMDLETELQEDDNTRKLIHRPSEGGSFFNPYPNQDRHELLQSLFKVQGGGLHYHNDQKVMGLDFHPSGNVIMGQGQTGLSQTGQGQMGQFPPIHFRNEPILPSNSLELKQKRLSEIYMHQNIQDNMYPNLGRYSIPRQEQQHFTPLNIQDWGPVNPVNNAHISAPPASHLNGGDTASHNWFYGENRSRSVWTGSEIGSNPSVVGSDNSNADQNLFSVISQCNELGPSPTYNPMGPTERLIQPSNYGVIGAGPATNMVPRRTNPLNFLGGGHETGSVLKLNNNNNNNNNNLGWVNLPNQTTALQDSMGKTFLSPWNH